MLDRTGFPPGVSIEESHFPASDGASLRLVSFTPPEDVPAKPRIVFLPGWISPISGWQRVLEVLSAEHPILYVETREKSSAVLPEGKSVDFSMDRLCADLDEILSTRVPEGEAFCFFGSSLGSTLILDYLSRGLREPVLALLVAPNLIFRLPGWVVIAAKLLPPAAYPLLRPLLKWYLCTFLLNEEEEPEQAERYRRSLDDAEPRRLRANALELKDYSAWEKLPDVRVPVVIVTGETDSLHHLDDMRRLESELPRARLEIMGSNRETHGAKAARLALREIEEATARRDHPAS